MNAQYRTRTDPPTEPGLYWARHRLGREITPVIFAYWKTVYVHGMGKSFILDDFDWFGPVDPVREG